MAINIINSLKKIGQAIVSLQSKKMNKNQLDNIINKYYNLLSYTDITAGTTDWTIEDFSKVQLYNNTLLINVYATRSSATGSGNITDQKVCTFTINDERITSIPSYWSALTYVSGTVNKGLFKRTNDSKPWECAVFLTHTHEATTVARFRFAIPVTIDVTKF